MSHEIAVVNGKASIAYANETPWHGLGAQLSPDAPVEVWTKEAGLDFEVTSTPVMFNNSVGTVEYVGQKVLYRNDTKKPLSVVSNRYNVVQPREVMDLIAEVCSLAGFELEVAGALSGGRRIWALAKITEGAPIIGQDEVRPYFLIATSYDGSMSTIGKLVIERVVCHNTITAALVESAKSTGPVKQVVKVPHFNNFDPKAMRLSLGIYKDSFEKWTLQTRILAQREIDLATAQSLTEKVFQSVTPATQHEHIRTSRGFREVMNLFDGNAIGSDIDGGFTLWRLLNATTQYVDHSRGRSQDSRLTAAWFGSGDALKASAYTTLLNAA